MNPVLLGKQVEESLRELVHCTLNTTSTGFIGAIDWFLSNPNHFLKGPWVTLDLPFKNIQDANGYWKEPYPDIPLQFAPYIHQSKVFERLSGKNPLSTLIATSTGSGKTEAYLWPILEYCRQHLGEPGIKAILVYPMNALASDQARRLALTVTENPALTGIRAGIYSGAEPSSPSDAVTSDSLINRRDTLRQYPPDILLTNYKMLDLLLLRGDDLPLWSQNDKQTLKFLVVDELHTFDGAQGADLALLIRRIKHRISVPENYLTCIGSSATLGAGDGAAERLVEYAETIFGESFPGEAVVRESRVSARDLLKPIEYFDIPNPEDVQDKLREAVESSQTEAARNLAKFLFHDENDPDLAPLHSSSPESDEFRLSLGRLLKEHWVGQRLIEIISQHSGPISIKELSAELGKAKPLRNWNQQTVSCLTELVLSLVSWARSGQPKDQKLRPLFNLRIQVWLREMGRMVAGIPCHTGEEIVHAKIHHADDLDAVQLKKKLPVVNCQRCGSSAYIGRENADSSSYYAPLNTIYDEFFETYSPDKLRLFYTDQLPRQTRGSATRRVFPGLMCPDSLEFEYDGKQQDVSKGRIPIWMYNPVVDKNLDRTCPACGKAQSLFIFGIRSARMTAALSSTLFTSMQNEVRPDAKPRLLLFSDSVQDAAQRGAVTELRNFQSVVQKALYSELVDSSKDYTLASLCSELPKRLHAELESDQFVAQFIPRDLVWWTAYQSLCNENTPIQDRKLMRGIEERLGWSIFENLTYKSHLPSSQEGQGIAAAGIQIDQLDETARKFGKQLGNEFSDLVGKEPARLIHFIFGVLEQIRKQGSVSHPLLERAITKSNKDGWLGWIGASMTLGLGRMMPAFGHRDFLTPRPVSLQDKLKSFHNINSDAMTNWYREWIFRCLFDGEHSAASPRDVYQILLERLVNDGWLKAFSRDGDHDSRPIGYLLDSEQVRVSSRVSLLVCVLCRRREVTLIDNRELMVGMPCMRLSCKGYLQPAENKPKTALLQSLNSDRNHRVVAREHTGLLDTDTRLKIEKSFIEQESTWDANLISATPTLEMGIDIGELSSVLLCSVPPEEANYVQRMGRSGRRDGNALNLVLANARPHDLQFWEDPLPMLKGEVRTPGVYIGAEAVLLRQITAFTLDSYVFASQEKGDFGKVREVRKRRETSQSSGFPMDWFSFIESNGEALAAIFIGLLPAEVQEQTALSQRLNTFVVSDGENSMRWKVTLAFDESDQERKRLVDKREELNREKRKLKENAAEFTEKEKSKREEAIELDRNEINRLIRNGIDEVPVIKFLTDRGLLPNYAFPEEGVNLTALLSRREGNETADDDLISVEYQRPASSALSEFALGQTFYAEGRQVKITRLNMSSEDLTSWRFCQSCSYVENTALGDDHSQCPQCEDPMWSDSGQVKEVIQLKSVLATSSEAKAAIHDADQRIQLQFDRAMLPHYESSAISATWLAVDESISTPFGYEMISRCTFRDFNFGERTDFHGGPTIAGRPRQSIAFRICRYCGTQQSKVLKPDEQGKHPPSCPVIKNKIVNQPEWLSHSFLMRSFDTEAIRILIPVFGEVNHDQIKSFVAAINLGLRHYFSGRVDHIRSTIDESRLHGMSTVRSLFLYDSIPGGSGYLRQLAENTGAMKAVISKAFKALDTCPCSAEDKTGCYLCVKTYRSQFGPGEPDRDLSRSMMESVLNQWEFLQKQESALDQILPVSIVRSELEALFLEALKTEFGADSLTPKVVGNGIRGYVLSTGKDNPLWEIEPQVQVKSRFRNMPQRVVDFLITPIDRNRSKPIIIEADGIRYHADTLHKDILDRLQMIRSKEVIVWTLAWHDLSKDQVNTFSNPLSQEALKPISMDSLDMARSLSLFEKYTALMEQVQADGSFQLLKQTLQNPEVLKVPTAILIRGIVGNHPVRDALQRLKILRNANADWLGANEFLQTTLGDQLDLYLSVSRVTPKEFIHKFDDIRTLIRFQPQIPLEVSEISCDFIKVFRGFWRCVNLLQTFNGLQIEFPGLDTLALPFSTDTDYSDAVVDSAWNEVCAEALEEFLPLINALIAAEVEAPDAIGEEILDDNRVLGSAELGWTSQDVWVTDDDTMKKGNVIVWDRDHRNIVTVVDEIISQLGKRR